MRHLLLLGGLVLATPPEGGYHLLKKYELGAAPGGKEYWDYITFDAPTRRLFISHNTEVKVVNADNGSIIGNIPDLRRVQRHRPRSRSWSRIHQRRWRRRSCRFRRQKLESHRSYQNGWKSGLHSV